MQLRQQRRFCDGDVFRNSGAVFHNGNVFRDDGIFRNAGVFRNADVFRIKGLAVHSIMNVSVSFPFWHKFAVVNDGFFGMQEELYKRPGQKHGDSQGAQKSPSA